MKIDFTDKELEFIRMALRDAEERYRKSEFRGLAEASANLRNKISDAILDNYTALV